MTDYSVDILHTDTLEVVGRCGGPRGGACSIATGVVGCAGCRISPADASPEYAFLWVPPGSRHCPLAWDLEVVGL
jgi:hypothetical protein